MQTIYKQCERQLGGTRWANLLPWHTTMYFIAKFVLDVFLATKAKGKIRYPYFYQLKIDWDLRICHCWQFRYFFLPQGYPVGLMFDYCYFSFLLNAHWSFLKWSLTWFIYLALTLESVVLNLVNTLILSINMSKINVSNWLEESKDDFSPPVCNKMM